VKDARWMLGDTRSETRHLADDLIASHLLSSSLIIYRTST
jgi:hypothetical protein